MVNLANNEEMKDYQKPEMEVIELHTEGNLLDCTSEEYRNNKCYDMEIIP